MHAINPGGGFAANISQANKDEVAFAILAIVGGCSSAI
jgi:hypothetical protein